ncbi:MAG TPA: MATE family efflux transporter [Gemmatimonadaceae bacterium]|nr:MATE family efflux transporter [Gemmatimonadaceae bacterium]
MATAANRPPADGTSPLRTEFRALVSLALPVVVVQVGLMGMGVIDSIMVGHVSARALAAVALGNIYFFNVIVFAMGTLMALDPIVAQAVGARDDAAVARGIQRGMLLAVALSVVCAAVMAPATRVITLARQPAEIIPDAAAYVRISILGVLPFLAFVVLRQSLQAMHELAPIVLTIVGANALNAGLNWVFIYGHLGSAPLGVEGSAIATVVSRWVMFAALLALSWRTLRRYLMARHADAWKARALARMLAIGIPIGLQQVLEVGAFGAIGLFMGWFGTAQVAAHQIAIQLAALTFMVPLGVSAAAAVRVGQAIGAHDGERARRAARAAFLCGVGFMSGTALLFLTLPEALARLFTTDGAVIGIASLLIPVAGVFQVFDGIQAVAAGVLRGIGDTRAPLVAMLAGYWAIGLPVSLYLGFRTAAGPTGLWWGFVAGLSSVALFLSLRVAALFRGELTRLHVDDERAAVE